MLDLDPADNVFVLTAKEAGLQVDLIGPGLRETFDIADSQGAVSPHLRGNSRGIMYGVFQRADLNGVHDIWLTSNSGGPFSVPRNLSEHPGDDIDGHVVLDRDGDPFVTWTRDLGQGQSRVMLYDVAAREASELAEGRFGAVVFGRSDERHVAYQRESTIYYRGPGEGGALGAEQVAVALTGDAPATIRMGLDELGNLIVVYAHDGALSYLTRSPEDDAFSPPRFIDGDGVSEPNLRVRAGGVLTIIYAKSGDLWVVQGIPGFLLSPEPVAETEAVETTPSVEVDNCGSMHVAAVADGTALYSNNAGDVSADFTTTTPPSGRGPLTVQFQDLSNGKVQIWNWDFGDGENATVANPVHTYALPGRYTVRLTVFNADRESTEVKEDFIFVQESNNTMEIPDQRVVPDQRGVWFPVLASHVEPLKGFQVHAIYDPAVLVLDQCSFDNTSVGAIDPEFAVCNYFDRRIEVGVIFELEPPFDGTVLEPGQNQRILNLIFDVSNGAPLGTTEVRLVNNRAVSRIFNIFTIDGRTVLPVLKSSEVEVLDVFSFPTFFLRGDADRNGNVEITDAISILNYLFPRWRRARVPRRGGRHRLGPHRDHVGDQSPELPLPRWLTAGGSLSEPRHRSPDRRARLRRLIARRRRDEESPADPAGLASFPGPSISARCRSLSPRASRTRAARRAVGVNSPCACGIANSRCSALDRGGCPLPPRKTLMCTCSARGRSSGRPLAASWPIESIRFT